MSPHIYNVLHSPFNKSSTIINSFLTFSLFLFKLSNFNRFSELKWIITQKMYGREIEEERQEEDRQHLQRLAAFDAWPNSFTSPLSLGENDCVMCNECGHVLDGWTSERVPFREHSEKSPGG
jgi:hypothetical protein